MADNWSQGTIKTSVGVELFYTRTGNGDKPAVVFAHGFTDQGNCWHMLASALEADYDVIMYDAYGHGKSSRIDPKKRFDLVEDMHDFILALELDKPGVVGHSMGAATAAGFAAKYPDMLTCVALEDPPFSDQVFKIDGETPTISTWKEAHLENCKKSVKELVEMQKGLFPDWEEAILPQWAESKLALDVEIFDNFALPATDWREIAKAIQVPTLLITGDNDKGAIVTPAIGVEAVELLAHGEFGHISGVGHCAHYGQFQPFLTMLKLFLKRNLPAK